MTLDELPDVCRPKHLIELLKPAGISKNSVYAALESGQIPSAKLGDRYLISRAAIVAWLGNGKTNDLTDSNRQVVEEVADRTCVPGQSS